MSLSGTLPRLTDAQSRQPGHRVQMGKLRPGEGESLAADPSRFRTWATWCPRWLLVTPAPEVSITPTHTFPISQSE